MRICYIWDFIILQIICTSFIISNVTIKYYDPTMILLMGMWISLTKNPMNPIIANPMAVATAIFWNSKKEYQWIYDIQPQYNQTDLKVLEHNPRIIKLDVPFLSGFVHRLTSRMLSFENCLRGSNVCTIWSMLSI